MCCHFSLLWEMKEEGRGRRKREVGGRKEKEGGR